MTDPKPIDTPDAPDDDLPEPANDVVDEPVIEIVPRPDLVPGSDPEHDLDGPDPFTETEPAAETQSGVEP